MPRVSFLLSAVLVQSALALQMQKMQPSPKSPRVNQKKTKQDYRTMGFRYEDDRDAEQVRVHYISNEKGKPISEILNDSLGSRTSDENILPIYGNEAVRYETRWRTFVNRSITYCPMLLGFIRKRATDPSSTIPSIMESPRRERRRRKRRSKSPGDEMEFDEQYEAERRLRKERKREKRRRSKDLLELQPDATGEVDDDHYQPRSRSPLQEGREETAEERHERRKRKTRYIELPDGTTRPETRSERAERHRQKRERRQARVEGRDPDAVVNGKHEKSFFANEDPSSDTLVTLEDVDPNVDMDEENARRKRRRREKKEKRNKRRRMEDGQEEPSSTPRLSSSNPELGREGRLLNPDTLKPRVRLRSRSERNRGRDSKRDSKEDVEGEMRNMVIQDIKDAVHGNPRKRSVSPQPIKASPGAVLRQAPGRRSRSRDRRRSRSRGGRRRRSGSRGRWNDRNNNHGRRSRSRGVGGRRGGRHDRGGRGGRRRSRSRGRGPDSGGRGRRGDHNNRNGNNNANDQGRRPGPTRTKMPIRQRADGCRSLMISGTPRDIEESKLCNILFEIAPVQDIKIMRNNSLVCFKQESDVDVMIKAIQDEKLKFDGRLPVSVEFSEWVGPGWGPTSEKQPGCTTIFIGNLPMKCDEIELRELFGKHGEITTIAISTGYAHLKYMDPDSVDKAVNDLTGADFKGRKIRLDYATDRNQNKGKGKGKGRHVHVRDPPKERPPGCFTVWIGGITKPVTEQLLVEEFQCFGAVVGCRITKPKEVVDHNNNAPAAIENNHQKDNDQEKNDDEKNDNEKDNNNNDATTGDAEMKDGEENSGEKKEGEENADENNNNDTNKKSEPKNKHGGNIKPRMPRSFAHIQFADDTHLDNAILSAIHEVAKEICGEKANVDWAEYNYKGGKGKSGRKGKGKGYNNNNNYHHGGGEDHGYWDQGWSDWQHGSGKGNDPAEAMLMGKAVAKGFDAKAMGKGEWEMIAAKGAGKGFKGFPQDPSPTSMDYYGGGGGGGDQFQKGFGKGAPPMPGDYYGKGKGKGKNGSPSAMITLNNGDAQGKERGRSFSRSYSDSRSFYSGSSRSRSYSSRSYSSYSRSYSSRSYSPRGDVGGYAVRADAAYPPRSGSATTSKVNYGPDYSKTQPGEQAQAAGGYPYGPPPGTGGHPAYGPPPGAESFGKGGSDHPSSNYAQYGPPADGGKGGGKPGFMHGHPPLPFGPPPHFMDTSGGRPHLVDVEHFKGKGKGGKPDFDENDWAKSKGKGGKPDFGGKGMRPHFSQDFAAEKGGKKGGKSKGEMMAMFNDNNSGSFGDDYDGGKGGGKGWPSDQKGKSKGKGGKSEGSDGIFEGLAAGFGKGKGGGDDFNDKGMKGKGRGKGKRGGGGGGRTKGRDRKGGDKGGHEKGGGGAMISMDGWE
eukprot:gene35-507_t